MCPKDLNPNCVLHTAPSATIPMSRPKERGDPPAAPSLIRAAAPTWACAPICFMSE